MKRIILILSILLNVNALIAQRFTGKKSGKVSSQRTCFNCDAGCNLCYMEDPRAQRNRGLMSSRYYQGYPYYGYYQYGSSMGFSFDY